MVDEDKRGSRLTRSAALSEFTMYRVVTKEQTMDVKSSTADEEFPAQQPDEKGQTHFSGWLDTAKMANMMKR